jgi:hypothetical protein
LSGRDRACHRPRSTRRRTLTRTAASRGPAGTTHAAPATPPRTYADKIASLLRGLPTAHAPRLVRPPPPIKPHATLPHFYSFRPLAVCENIHMYGCGTNINHIEVEGTAAPSAGKPRARPPEDVIGSYAAPHWLPGYVLCAAIPALTILLNGDDHGQCYAGVGTTGPYTLSTRYTFAARYRLQCLPLNEPSHKISVAPVFIL